ncbi:hypothetical protein M5K25_010043 [Dendrobium thyrsiflorum]|uniref:Uncharacterized protein n=1 Tax=Dendrobium thyrsiflorum TaxID=117978 RepID=A0ABD0UZ52_DENTH
MKREKADPMSLLFNAFSVIFFKRSQIYYYQIFTPLSRLCSPQQSAKPRSLNCRQPAPADRRWKEAVHRKPPNVEVHLLDCPRLLHPRPRVSFLRLTKSKQRNARPTGVRDLDAVDRPGVADDFHAAAAARSEGGGFGVEAENETIVVVDCFLSDAHGAGEETFNARLFVKTFNKEEIEFVPEGSGEGVLAVLLRHETAAMAILPLLPALILQPDTTSSRHHRSGRFCHRTKPPISPLQPPPAPFPAFLPLPLLLPPPPGRSSVAAILTLPIAYMLLIAFSAFSPPAAAMYCCTMYFAIDAS